MANQRLTDKTELTAPDVADKFEVVDVSDTSQNPAGSTKWITWATLKAYFLKFTGLSDVIDTTLEGKEGQVPTVYTPIGSLTPKLKLTPIPSYTDLYSGNTIISGGIQSPGTGTLTYRVWASSFIINNVKYDEFVSANVTLDDGDPTDPRIDVFAIEVNAFVDPPTFSVVVIEGTPDASPVKPSVDLTNQVEVSFRVIAANETNDTDTVVDLIYNEATGEPNEWNNTYLLAGGNLTDTSSPYLGAVSLSVPAVTNDYVQWTNLTDITYLSDQKLNFAIKLSAWNNGQTIEFKIIDSATGTYRLLSVNGLNAREFGINIVSTAWQPVQIPLSRFVKAGFVNTFNRLEVRFRSTAPMLLDWFNIQSGLGQPPTFVYVKSVVAGSNIAVDNSDPERPVVSADLSDYYTALEVDEEISGARFLQQYTIGTLPTPPGAGLQVYVTDGTDSAVNPGTPVGGTGTTVRVVFYNGTIWTY
jgi:hypothetical protein